MTTNEVITDDFFYFTYFTEENNFLLEAKQSSNLSTWFFLGNKMTSQLTFISKIVFFLFSKSTDRRNAI